MVSGGSYPLMLPGNSALLRVFPSLSRCRWPGHAPVNQFALQMDSQVAGAFEFLNSKITSYMRLPVPMSEVAMMVSVTL
jgi:hypothetical protein